MPVYKREDIPRLIKAIKNDDVCPIYLLFGERFLCRDLSDQIITALLPDEKQRRQNVREIDGDRENPATTMNLLLSYSLFGGRQLIRVVDSRLFLSKTVAKTFWNKAVKAWESKDTESASRHLGRMLGLAGLSADDVGTLSATRWQTLLGFAKPGNVDWVKKIAVEERSDGGGANSGADLVEEALANGVPPQNTLILVAEAVYKRKKLYKLIRKIGIIVDLAVDSGATTAARKVQDNVVLGLIRKTLTDFQKKIEPQGLKLLMERVGFHPVAVVNETEKLALFSGDAVLITAADVDAIVGRTREEALFEFTEAFAGVNLAGTLRSLDRLLENGIHPLVIVAGLRNLVRKLLLARSFQEQKQPCYMPGRSYPVFQRGYLAQLKEAREEWPSLLSGHPYVIYKTFLQAEKFSLEVLKQSLSRLLDTEQALKGSSVNNRLILENFLFSFFSIASLRGNKRAGIRS